MSDRREIRVMEIIELKDDPEGPADELEKDLLRLTNEYRKVKGLIGLVWCIGLVAIAREHSAMMGVKKVPLGHSGFDRKVEMYLFIPSSAAENVAFSIGHNVVETASVIVDG